MFNTAILYKMMSSDPVYTRGPGQIIRIFFMVKHRAHSRTVDRISCVTLNPWDKQDKTCMTERNIKRRGKKRGVIQGTYCSLIS